MNEHFKIKKLFLYPLSEFLDAAKTYSQKENNRCIDVDPNAEKKTRLVLGFRY
jgi:hypothetical protein